MSRLFLMEISRNIQALSCIHFNKFYINHLSACLAVSQRHLFGNFHSDPGVSQAETSADYQRSNNLSDWMRNGIINICLRP